MPFGTRLIWSLLAVCSLLPTALAETAYFVVSETGPGDRRNDAYVLPLERAEDIAHARDLIADGPEIGGAIAVAEIAPGANGFNRNVLAVGKPQWSWHVVEFEGFADNTIEILDGSPSLVEEDVDGWMENTGGLIGFWGYTVTGELPAAPVFLINAGLNDAWVAPGIFGQGFFVNVFPAIGRVFLAWFTYDTERPGEHIGAVLGEPGHRWLTAFGPYQRDRADMAIEVTRGGIFNAAQPAPDQHFDGTILLEFTTCNAATVTFDIPSIGEQGDINLERITPDNISLCRALEAELQDQEPDAEPPLSREHLGR